MEKRSKLDRKKTEKNRSRSKLERKKIEVRSKKDEKRFLPYRYPWSSEFILKSAGGDSQKLPSRFPSVLSLESDEVRDF